MDFFDHLTPTAKGIVIMNGSSHWKRTENINFSRHLSESPQLLQLLPQVILDICSRLDFRKGLEDYHGMIMGQIVFKDFSDERCGMLGERYSQRFALWV